MNTVAEILGAIRESLRNARNALWQPEACENPEYEIAYSLDVAFLQTRLLLEAQGLPRMLTAVEQLHDQAKKDYSKSAMGIDEPYLVWAAELWRVLAAVERVYAVDAAGSVTKEIVEILRATEYAITDQECFTGSPSSERDVHVRIEAVLRCVFPDLLTKPTITKPIKNFEPDTGLPSVRTLIEYKFVTSPEDAKRVSGEILADTRGYISRDWDKFIYVVYETRRVKRESEWERLMRASGVGDNTRVIVISGEESKSKRTRPARRGSRLQVGT